MGEEEKKNLQKKAGEDGEVKVKPKSVQF